jgi:DNA mismatch endonuclease (patch repair protein)
MPDFLTAEERSAHMRKIRKVDTQPELLVREEVRKLGFKFRLYRQGLPGTPDLVFPRLKKVIFVHGCFWHQHSGCRLARIPKSRLEYWRLKFEKNRKRDRMVLRQLRRQGWRTLVLWECEAATPRLLRRKLKLFFKARRTRSPRTQPMARVR